MMTQRNLIELVAQAIASLDKVRVQYDPEAEGPTEGKFVALDQSSIHPDVKPAVKSLAQDGLFTHQHAAVESVLAGHHTVAATRTSSGKSMIFTLPALDALCRDPNSTSLFLYPQKALANDQLAKLQSTIAAIPNLESLRANKPHLVSRYDGSTPSEQRRPIREQAQLLLTNPDMLHLGILQYHHSQWAPFFKNLKTVAIDECHEYRGIFGTNVSYILRRLRQVCRLHGSNPTFVATSATVEDPQSHLRELVGCDFRLIGSDLDGSKQGRRKFYVLSGPENYLDFSRRLSKTLVDAGLRVLAFCPSRISAERMLAKMRTPNGELESHVAVYRSGLTAEERETIEAQLRDGSKKLVFSTSALELGIDIGGLDVVICVGLPGSMMSLWQRAGRVARAGREGAILLVPGETPIDAYYARNPQSLFDRQNETLALNLANERVACQHYACAMAESPQGETSLALDIMGTTATKIQQLRNDGKLNRPEFYLSNPHGEVSIRNTGESNYQLVCDQETVGEIGSFHLLREAPRGALYRHNGRIYRVMDIITGKKIVRLKLEATRNETSSLVLKKIRQQYPLKISEYSELRMILGRIEVTEFLQSVTERDPSGKVFRTTKITGMPRHQLPTEGVALILSKSFVDRVSSRLKGRIDESLASIERLMVNLFPIIAGPCDTQDVSSGIEKETDGSFAIYLYDNVYDGVNLTEIAFEKLLHLLEKVQDRILNCDCPEESGCFRCISDPQRNSLNSKQDATQVVQEILAVLRGQTPRQTCFERPDDGFQTESPEIICPVCNAPQPAKSKFCSECGERLLASALSPSP
jgi:DEAD/DEAH box helicase domain-containing protein